MATFEDYYSDDEIFDMIDVDDKVDNFDDPEVWTIITALNRVLDLSKRSGLSEMFWIRA